MFQTNIITSAKTVKDQVFEFLKANPNSRTRDIVKALGKGDKHIGVVLHGMKKEGLIESVKYGTFRVKDTTSASREYINMLMHRNEKIGKGDHSISLEDIKIIKLLMEKYGEETIKEIMLTLRK